MARYLMRRLLMAIPVLWGISLILFTLLALAPGDPLGEFVLNPNIPPEVRANLRQQFGLDDPVLLRYGRWFTAMLHGDWGYSFVSRVPALTLIVQRLPTTLFVMGAAYGLAVLIAFPVGILSALKPYTLFDQIATTVALLGAALPTFVTGLLGILLFSSTLGWLPFIYSSTIDAHGLAWVLASLRQSAMPIVVLGCFEAASLTRFVRASLLDVLTQEYVHTARAKGLSEARTVLKHALRNALIPIVTVVALHMPTMVTGAVITEQMFRVPGMGALLIAAIESTDTPVVMAITFVYAVLVLVCTVLADCLYGLLDPRITYRARRA